MAPTPPAHRVLSTRIELPKPEAPITYREEVYVVEPDTSRESVEVLLLERFQRVRAELASNPPGQLVRLAVFDIAFEGRPPHLPLGTLAWKDWRGSPVLGFPFFGVEAPPVTASLPPRPLQSHPPAASAPAPAASVPAPAAAASVPAPAASVPAPAAASVPAAAASVPAPAASVPAPAPVQSAPPPAAPIAFSNGAAVQPSPEPLGARRSADDDLIGELFERLHELVFENSVVAGASFVLDVLLDLIPSKYAMVQVFDLNTRNFVVVRARGPGLDAALLEATPDTDPLVTEVMRKTESSQFDTDGDARFQQGRWRRAATPPKRVLCGGVSQSGRYLGLIELGDPAGGQPFNGNEINALDYACEQFAGFVATHPVVIDRDVVLGG